MFYNGSRDSGRYENGFLHGDDVPTKAEVDNEGKRLPLNHVRNAIEVDRAIKDGINAAKVTAKRLYILHKLLGPQTDMW